MRSFSISPAGLRSSGLRLSICLILRIGILFAVRRRVRLLLVRLGLARELRQEVLVLVIGLGEVVDAIGGQVNAYTTREGTCYYASVLDGYSAARMEFIPGLAIGPAGRPAFV